MDDRSVCSPQLAESDAETNTTSAPNAASVTDADKVVNTKIDSAQSEGDLGEEQLLKGLLTDDYCHVCEAVLLFESQRLSHYEGKKHAQKLKLYLQAKRAEKMNKESSGPQRAKTVDKDRFCELCSMVFSSPVVARSHYEGKVHAKNLRKQGLQPTDISLKGAEMPTLPNLAQASTNADQTSAREGGMEPLDPAATTMPSTEVDLRDPNKYCALCAASFNNPQMALQHYNGRKHQRNHARQELLKELGEDAQQGTAVATPGSVTANSLTCQMCSVKFNSVEMYQAHMQGNKHQIKEKKVVDLCKSQQKVYSTFADELADYVQVQKARGITPNTSHALPQRDTELEGEEEEGTNTVDSVQLNKSRPNLPPPSNRPHHPHPGSYYPAAGWHPPYQGPPANYSLKGTSCGWEYNFPPPPLPGAGSPQFTNWPMAKRRRRNQSSSSSYTTSSSSWSSSSSYSSSSDSDDSEYQHRERKRRIRRNRGERGRRAREEDSGEERRGKRQSRVRDDDSEERRRIAESEKERRRKRQKNHGKGRRPEKKSREEDCEEEGGERVMKDLKPEDPMEKREGTEVHMQVESNIEQGEREQAKPSKPKHRKEKKKTKEKVDTRTEEERLWDESILGL
ncbi:zinc finger matrin-type protein 1 isoform X2 [Centroberyx affinis]|uniref:zinc finger matrin-type protein 1 isoform X2 n=1 Tax=Centroberyx affinis TaxID=166261 RepID=UPI003A5C4267